MKPDVFDFIQTQKHAGEAVVLATVIDSRGSTPVGEGSRMAVSVSGTAGTVGGGPLEARVIAAAREALVEGRARLLRFNLADEKTDDAGMICGGEQEVFLDFIEPPPRLLIFGAGHVGRALARLAVPAGFGVAVVDDREEYLAPASFPSGCRLITMPFDGDWADLAVTPGTGIVILTRGHAFDRTCLKKALSTSAGYIGMIGSRRKVAETVATLEAEGIPAGSDRRVYAPVGLDLGGDAPEEIAVSILAELIAVREGGRGGHLRDRAKND